jgi:hypothetical protein
MSGVSAANDKAIARYVTVVITGEQIGLTGLWHHAKIPDAGSTASNERGSLFYESGDEIPCKAKA